MFNFVVFNLGQHHFEAAARFEGLEDGGVAGPALEAAATLLSDGRRDGARSADGQILGTYLHGLFDQLEEALDARGYFRPADKKPKMVDNLRAVLSRPGFFLPEIRVLRGVVKSLDRYARKTPESSAGPQDREQQR